MPYFLSYVLNEKPDEKYFFGHASVVLTEYTPPEKPRIICKVGLFESNQVELEDKMYQPEKGYVFSHKTYPITTEEMSKFLQKINADRRIGILSDPNRKRAAEMTLQYAGGELKSTPGGPEFDYLRCNCKTYALSLLGATGIVDSSLSNWLIDMPKKSGALNPLTFEKTKEGWFWSSALVISKRLSSQKLSHTTQAEMDELNHVIRTNEYIHLFHDLSEMIGASSLNAVNGIAELRTSITGINAQLKTHQKPTDLNRLKEEADEAIRQFEATIKNRPYGMGQKLLDTLKSLSNYLLGTSHILSLQHKSRKIVRAHDHRIKKIDPLSHQTHLHTILHVHKLYAKKHKKHSVHHQSTQKNDRATPILSPPRPPK